MIVNLIVKDERIVAYRSIPLRNTEPMFELDNLPNDIISGEYGLVNNYVVKLGYTQKQINEQNEIKLNYLRIKREPLLNAFDLWEKAVLRGRATDDDTVMKWYTSLLNLEESAFENIPIVVQYYIR